MDDPVIVMCSFLCLLSFSVLIVFTVTLIALKYSGGPSSGGASSGLGNCKERLLAAMRGKIYVEEGPGGARGGAMILIFPPETEAIEIAAKIRNAIKASSVAETRQTADVTISVTARDECVAKYQGGHSLNVVHIVLGFVGKDGIELLHEEFLGKAPVPAQQIYVMLGDKKKETYVGTPTNDVLAYVERLLRTAGALNQHPYSHIAERFRDSAHATVQDTLRGPTPGSPFSSGRRTWEDSTGKYTVMADFEGAISGNVKLRKPDGSPVTVPIEKLCEEDQAWVKQRLGNVAAAHAFGESQHPSSPFGPAPGSPFSSSFKVSAITSVNRIASQNIDKGCLRGCAITVAVVVAFLFLMFLLGTTDDASWGNAQGEKTITAYESYLRMHPQGSHASEARARMQRLMTEREIAWKSIKATVEPADLDGALGAYLEKFSNGSRSVNVFRKKRKEYVDGLRSSDSVTRAQYTGFVADHGRHAILFVPYLIALLTDDTKLEIWKGPAPAPKLLGSKVRDTTVREQAAFALKRITENDFGTHARRWQEWWGDWWTQNKNQFH